MLYCILGDSGSGKDSIVDYLVKLNTCERLVTNTTRPIRIGETMVSSIFSRHMMI